MQRSRSRNNPLAAILSFHVYLNITGKRPRLYLFDCASEQAPSPDKDYPPVDLIDTKSKSSSSASSRNSEFQRIFSDAVRSRDGSICLACGVRIAYY
jgi:hypothetical protein